MEYAKIMWRLSELSGKTDRIRYELEADRSLGVKGLRGTRCPNGLSEKPPDFKQECVREIINIIQDAEAIRKILIKDLTE